MLDGEKSCCHGIARPIKKTRRNAMMLCKSYKGGEINKVEKVVAPQRSIRPCEPVWLQDWIGTRRDKRQGHSERSHFSAKSQIGKSSLVVRMVSWRASSLSFSPNTISWPTYPPPSYHRSICVGFIASNLRAASLMLFSITAFSGLQAEGSKSHSSCLCPRKTHGHESRSHQCKFDGRSASTNSCDDPAVATSIPCVS
jgi:hypothetical protein